MRFVRYQQGEVSSPFDFRIFDGQVGRGIYAVPVPSRGSDGLRRYYTLNGENAFWFTVPDSLVIKFQQRCSYQAAEHLMQQHPDRRAFIFRHRGIGIPTGWQAVITDPSVIRLE